MSMFLIPFAIYGVIATGWRLYLWLDGLATNRSNHNLQHEAWAETIKHHSSELNRLSSALEVEREKGRSRYSTVWGVIDGIDKRLRVLEPAPEEPTDE